MNHDHYAYCSNVPEGLSEALELLRNEEKYGPRQVFLNPIPTAIAG